MNEPIRAGEFAVTQERDSDGTRTYRIVRVTESGDDGIVTAYTHPDDYPGCAVPRVRTMPLYAVDAQHTRTLIDATDGVSQSDLTFETPHAAHKAVLGMIGGIQ